MKHSLPYKKKSQNRGDESDHLFQELYAKYFGRLYLYSKAIVQTSEVAEDVVADVFLNLWNNKHSLSEIKDLESYLLVSVKNLSLRAVSKDPRHFDKSAYEQTARTVDSVDPEQIYLGDELRAVLEDEIEGLSDMCQLVFRMAKEEGKSYQDISEELGISTSTVKSHLMKALNKLRKALDKHYNSDSIDSTWHRRFGTFLFSL